MNFTAFGIWATLMGSINKHILRRVHLNQFKKKIVENTVYLFVLSCTFSMFLTLSSFFAVYHKMKRINTLSNREIVISFGEDVCNTRSVRYTIIIDYHLE